MAKKNEDVAQIEQDTDEIDAKSKIITIILSILFFIILLGAFVIFVKLDVGGFGSSVMRPIFKNVDGVNKILPEVDDDVLIQENNYPYKDISEAVKKIDELNAEIDKLKSKNDDISKEVSDKDKEVTRLQEFEKNQTEFQQKVDDFYDKVVYNDNAPDVEEYISYYEQIEPENAEKLYKEAIIKNQATETITKLANTYSKMDSATAAKDLEELEKDMSLVCNILNTMGEKDRAKIMNEMSASFAAKVTKKISDD